VENKMMEGKRKVWWRTRWWLEKGKRGGEKDAKVSG
jgi:hypothetical protein